MDDPEKAAPRPSIWPWALWGLTTFALFCASYALWRVLGFCQTLYVQAQVRSLPWETELLMKLRNEVPAWLPPFLLCLSGVSWAQKGDGIRTQRWSLVMLLAMVILGSTLVYILMSTHVYGSGGLSK